jgi:ABC-type nitrate/sulfonate/bicarbonate transport system substrate-binding protein
MLAALTIPAVRSEAQPKDLGEVNILTAVSNMAFSALWVAEQLKYFEQEGVRAKITPAGGGAPARTLSSAARRIFAHQVQKDSCWRKSKERP